MAKDKELYYEIIEEEPKDGAESAGGERGLSTVTDATEVTAERDHAAELAAAVGAVKRVRYRVREGSASGNAFAVIMFTCAVIAACGILIHISKSKLGVIFVSSITIAAVVVAVVIMIYTTVKARRVHYCYYARTERGVFCMSVINDEATLFAYGTAYRITRDAFLTLDARGYAEWLDGEGTGLFSLTAAAEKIGFDENVGRYTASFGKAEHEVVIDDGRILEIVSVQPYKTDEIDPKTGESKSKKKVFIKSDPTEEFAWEVPPFVKQAFSDNGVEFPDLTGL